MTTATPQPDNSGGCMLALYPPEKTAKALALPGGLPVPEIHLTIAYTGDAADVDPEALNAVARNLARRDPFTVQVSGAARFTGGDTDVAVALADSPALEDLRRDALDQLAAAGIAVPRDHGYTPHITRQYVAPDAPDPAGRLAAFPVTFTAISAVHGNTRTDYELGGDSTESPLVSVAREAFAAGYRMTGAPVTPRARLAFEAAVYTACTHEDDPNVIGDTLHLGYLEGLRALDEQRGNHAATEGEPTLHLGKLTGVWADVYRRREELTAGHVAKITAIWQRMIKRLKPKKLVKAYQRTLIDAPAEAASDGGPDQWRKDEARAAALGWLYAIFRDPQYADLEQAIVAALIDALAEGRTAALAVAADQAAAAGFSWDKAYAAMRAALADLEQNPGIADPWAEKILGAAATDAGRVLAAAASGASDAQMAAAVMDAIAGEDPQAVSLMIDYAIGQSMAQASLSLYASEGILVAWLSAGDERVCLRCEANEAQGPYTPDQFPTCPAHPRCRCTPTPASPLPVSAFADFLVS